MDDKAGTISLAEARQALAREGEQRRQACLVAIRRVLQEHGCRLVAVPTLTEDGRIGAKLEIRDGIP